ncbi:MAG: T9SS type A sorting domain-containing protein [Candidatus Marinimicrobia bacterium]|nr:T9SS type A sorting domain-containing protein [Candidatus Neomarinimicrobiota bacterium]
MISNIKHTLVFLMSCIIVTAYGLAQDHFVVTISENGTSSLVTIQNSVTTLDAGDEVGIFDANGLLNDLDCLTPVYGELLVASGVWTGSQMDLTAIGSNDLCDFGGFQQSGFISGNPIIIKVWKAAEDVEYDATPTLFMGSGNFDGLFSVYNEITLDIPVFYNVVINEFFFRPNASDTPDYVELFNNDVADVDLTGWTLNGMAISGGTISANGYFLLAIDDPFFDVNGMDYYAGDNLPNSAMLDLGLGTSVDDIVLALPSGAIHDVVNYSNTLGWPTGTANKGYAAELRDPNFDNNDPASWASALETPISMYLYLDDGSEWDFGSPLEENTVVPPEGEPGCTDETACNYDPIYTIDDGSCLYLDCADECGGSAIVDECGVCDGPGIPVGECDCDGNVLGCDDVCGSGLIEDCFGECDGTGMLDFAEVCCYENEMDCWGECFGPGVSDPDGICCSGENLDCGGYCFGPNVEDCFGDCFGSGAENMGVEDPDGNCCYEEDLDCAGSCVNGAIVDDCGVCGGTNDCINYIPTVGLEVDHEGGIAWNVGLDGGGEPVAVGHDIYWGAAGIDVAYQYMASRDYLDPLSDTGLHVSGDIQGFTNFQAALAGFGFDPGLMTWSFAYASLGGDVEGVDWMYDPATTTETRYYTGGTYEIAYSGSPLFSGLMPDITMTIQYHELGTPFDDQISALTSYFIPTDASQDSGNEIQDLAAAFLIDVGDFGVRFTMDSFQPAGQMEYLDTWRSGAYFEAQVSAIEGAQDFIGDPDCFGIIGGDAVEDDCGVCGGDNSSCTDCAGVINGDSYEDYCGICDNDPDNDSFWFDSLNFGGAYDCSGVCFGEAVNDMCETCDTDLENDCVQDCLDVWGGDAVYDDCGICDGPGIPEGDCDCDGNVLGCDDVCGSGLVDDECGVCDGSGIPEGDCDCFGSVDDCLGECGGPAVYDECMVCDGDNSSCADCAGIPNGPNVEDMCGACDDDAENDCVEDCFGVWGGTAEFDECDVCDGDGIPEGDCDCDGNVLGCDDVCGSGLEFDECDVCGGDGPPCGPWANPDPSAFEFNGAITAAVYFDDIPTGIDLDAVAVFYGDDIRGLSTGLYFPPLDIYEFMLTIYGDNTGSEILTFKFWDSTTNTIYDLEETVLFTGGMLLGDPMNPYTLNYHSVIYGCMDEEACNYYPDATEDDGTCEYGDTWYLDFDNDGFGDYYESYVACTQPQGYVDNDGDCNDTYENINPDSEEVCDGIDNDCDGEVDEGCEGCMDDMACNWDQYATIDDGSCTYPEDENHDCEGNCIVEEDCFGECGGSAIEDECGVCDGSGIPEGDCDCFGNVDDCLGGCGGSAIEDECGVCDGSGIPEGDCDCFGNVDDCLGECGGSAIEDECGVCDGPGVPEGDCDCFGNVDDCLGECGGSAIDDECGVCDGPGIPEGDCDCFGSVDDCLGECGGSAMPDECGVCDGPGIPEGDCDCDGNVEDCLGECGGPAIDDECGVCDGPGIPEGDCDCFGNVDDCLGECGGSTMPDECGVCDGPGIPEGDCDCFGNVDDCLGECGGLAEYDGCGVCDGDGTSCIPDGFEFNQSTMQAFYFFVTATISDLELEVGADWIGIFNGPICVGAAAWDGEYTSVVAMGDDGYGMTDGYLNPGDTPTFVIYDGSADDFYDAEAFGVTPNLEFANLAQIFIDELAAILTINFSLDLHAGANLISFYVLPDDNSLTTVLDGCVDLVSGVIGEGTVATPHPATPGAWIGNLDYFEATRGYWVLLDDDCTITFDGWPTDPATIFDLHAGANLVSYPFAVSNMFTDALPSDVLDLIIAIIGEGTVATPHPATPGEWIGNLDYLDGGKGYWYLLEDAVSFMYNSPMLSRSDFRVPIENNLSGYEYVQSSEQAFYFVDGIQLNDHVLSENDWLLAYNGNVLVGKARWQGEYTSIPVMGDNGTELSAGYCQAGDIPSFKLMKDFTGEVINLNGNIQTWESNGLYLTGLLDEAAFVPASFVLNEVYPNPFNPTTTISYSIPAQAEVQVMVFDIMGRQVAVLANEVQSEGAHFVTFDASGYSSGMYFVKLISNGEILSQKIMLMK